ncbi:basic proline-rich protein-like [Camelus dromedarius]|uniref:basic proline-rich protein-like n=1 Tax=Camelus dromedarius TaxID=9838 RepID=UPI00311A24E4
MSWHLTPVRVAIIPKPTKEQRYRGCGEKGTLLHCQQAPKGRALPLLLPQLACAPQGPGRPPLPGQGHPRGKATQGLRASLSWSGAVQRPPISRGCSHFDKPAYERRPRKPRGSANTKEGEVGTPTRAGGPGTRHRVPTWTCGLDPPTHPSPTPGASPTAQPRPHPPDSPTCAPPPAPPYLSRDGSRGDSKRREAETPSSLPPPGAAPGAPSSRPASSRSGSAPAPRRPGDRARARTRARRVQAPKQDHHGPRARPHPISPTATARRPPPSQCLPLPRPVPDPLHPRHKPASPHTQVPPQLCAPLGPTLQPLQTKHTPHASPQVPPPTGDTPLTLHLGMTPHPTAGSLRLPAAPPPQPVRPHRQFAPHPECTPTPDDPLSPLLAGAGRSGLRSPRRQPPDRDPRGPLKAHTPGSQVPGPGGRVGGARGHSNSLPDPHAPFPQPTPPPSPLPPLSPWVRWSRSAHRSPVDLHAGAEREGAAVARPSAPRDGSGQQWQCWPWRSRRRRGRAAALGEPVHLLPPPPPPGLCCQSFLEGVSPCQPAPGRQAGCGQGGGAAAVAAAALEMAGLGLPHAARRGTCSHFPLSLPPAWHTDCTTPTSQEQADLRTSLQGPWGSRDRPPQQAEGQTGGNPQGPGRPPLPGQGHPRGKATQGLRASLSWSGAVQRPPISRGCSHFDKPAYERRPRKPRGSANTNEGEVGTPTRAGGPGTRLRVPTWTCGLDPPTHPSPTPGASPTAQPRPHPPDSPTCAPPPAPPYLSRDGSRGDSKRREAETPSSLPPPGAAPGAPSSRPASSRSGSAPAPRRPGDRARARTRARR